MVENSQEQFIEAITAPLACSRGRDRACRSHGQHLDDPTRPLNISHRPHAYLTPEKESPGIHVFIESKDFQVKVLSSLKEPKDDSESCSSKHIRNGSCYDFETCQTFV